MEAAGGAGRAILAAGQGGASGVSDEDVHWSTPGSVYDVAEHCTGLTEGKPPCKCPCHVADSPWGSRGWYCDKCHQFWLQAPATLHPEGHVTEPPKVEYTHAQAIADGKSNPQPYMVPVVGHYFITKGNTLDDELGEHFTIEAEAKARAEELNRADVIASLNPDPAFAQRRARLQALGETFWVCYG